MPTVKRVLHPTDFSQHSAQAAQYASLLTQQFSAELYLLYVMEDAMGKIPDVAQPFPAPGESVGVDPDVWPHLAESIGVDADDPERVCLATRMGVVSDQIVSFARDHSIDIIVLGTHGRQGLAHALMGSVAEAVVRKSRCPVLTVRPEND